MEEGTGETAPQLRIASPVMILAGPSPATNELTQRLRSLDVKVLQAASITEARQVTADESPNLLVVDARLARRIPQLEDAVDDIRSGEEETALLAWFDADVPLEDILSLCRAWDDHMAGGIAVEESLRRLHFLTGRLPEQRSGERLIVGDLEMDTSTRTVTRAGVDIDLSDTEFRLLRLLMRHARTVLPKSQILQEVWEYEFAGQANIVQLYISYVRKKIEADWPRMIHTVRGAGYVLRPARGAEQSGADQGAEEQTESEQSETSAAG
ncbi:response regulator transcription factor [Nesterenkonia sp. MY13]|uniref:Response regulator transcription factor n=1 Tax=Nesterenkonia sedimenti TaxID=1463632 RepID=A0A7X8YDH1_9MICC|nr:response regulator transcription factor [Nesterenkonia sedimenti]NLS09157.1 response regulator transcription factor [Nesterenkonia sedimenti]